MSKLSLDYIVSKVDDINMLPNVLQEIIVISDDPNSTITDMENVILKDQTLTTKVLRLANSAYYGYARRISTISQATILLGFKTIKSIALASTVSKYMTAELKGYALEENQLWQQSQTCAIIARYISKLTKKADPEEAYIAGLLRDIGKTILNQNMLKEYEEVSKLVSEDGISFLQAEEMVFGFNHAEIGARVSEKWNLPSNLVDAISHHHNPENAEVDSNLVSIVHIADAITVMMGVGIGLDGLQYNLSEKAILDLELTEIDLENIISDISDLVSDSSSFDTK